MEPRHWQDWITGLVGVWLVASPWVLPNMGLEGAVTTAIFWNYLIGGGIAIGLAIGALVAFSAWEEYGDILLALWLLVSPWALGFTGYTTAALNTLFCGVIILIAAAWALYDARNTKQI